ncbi:hypothetical protein [Victivallis vadensis]|uniref:Uncharacterized protein n=1 Tax=Victivallis vadensis TaxID=172901 RepID=A0A848AW13_9BACT|nr:hypothetical protein [Victivallis vadensis]NMD87121.1 hypothetical protein [Victivallis vadensis]
MTIDIRLRIVAVLGTAVAAFAAQAADRAKSYFLAVGPQQEPDVPAGAFAGVAGVGEI